MAHHDKGESVEERIARLEERMANADEQRKEEKQVMDECKEALDKIMSELDRYKGFIGGLLFLGSCAAAFIKILPTVMGFFSNK